MSFIERYLIALMTIALMTVLFLTATSLLVALVYIVWKIVVSL